MFYVSYQVEFHLLLSAANKNRR